MVESKQFREDHAKDTNKEFKGIIKNASDTEINLLANFIKTNKYNVIGFSVVSPHFGLYKKIYNVIKDIDDIIIVLGGWQPSLEPEESIMYADFVCVGEGETAFLELVKHLEAEKPTDKILNFWYNDDGKIIKNPVRPLTTDISLFNIPIYDNKYSFFIENDELVNHELYFDNTRYGTFVGRGCPNKCTYCSNSYMVNVVYPKVWSKIRYRSVDHVKKEIGMIKEKLKNVDRINFYDEVFNPGIEWIQKFFIWYKKEINIPFYCFFFPGYCNEEKCNILSDAGLDGVWLGIQSGSERVRRKVYKRFYTNNQVIKQTKIFKKYGINVRYDFIFDNPFESFDESIESIMLMLELPTPFSLNLFSLKYFPNTEITTMALDAGMIDESDIDNGQVGDQRSYFIKQGVGKVENRFVNELAFYISCISSDPSFPEQKNTIIDMIDDFKKTRDIEPVDNLIKPWINETNNYGG